MDASTRFETQCVGALPPISHYFDLLSVGKIIDDVVPWEGGVPLGTLAEILIANRLLHPKAMFRIGDWAAQAGLTDYYGLRSEQLNDDLLGRALERLAAYANTVQSALVLKMIDVFDLDVGQIHYDISNVELFGAYEAAAAVDPAPTPLPTYGRTKSGRKNVKQIQFGINITRDGAVPLGQIPLDGNQSEATTHLENLKYLDTLLPKGKLLYIADTKLDTIENLLSIAARKGEFLCGGALLPHLQDEFRRSRGKLKPIEYYPQSESNLKPEERSKYQAFECQETISGTVDGRQINLTYRLMFIHSEAKAKIEAATRERHIAKIQQDFETVQKNVGKYTLKTYDAIIRRLEAAKGKYTEGKVFDYVVTESKGKFTVRWSISPDRVKEFEEIEGVYILKTNLPKAKSTLEQTLCKYKEQIHVERRIGNMKGPLAVAPMFLEKPARMAGLLSILIWALTIMALMERAVRRKLNGAPLYGLYPENRPSPAPTGTALLDCFSTLCIIIVKHHGTVSRRLADLSPIQAKLIELMSIPPNALKTFKRRCGM